VLGFTIKRICTAIPTLLVVLVIVFFLIRLNPGDPAEVMLGEYATPEALAQLRHQLGLDQPLWVQFGIFIGGALQGDFGRSLMSHQAVIREIGGALPYSLQLAAVSVLLSIVVGVPIGILSAVKSNSLLDYVTMTAALIGVSMPIFWFQILLLLVFSLYLGLFPVVGAGEAGNLGDLLHHLALPAVSLGLHMSAIIARMTRSSMLEVLSQDYIQTARAKGLRELRVIVVHGFRNAAIPVLTIIGINLGVMLGGAVVTETVFVRPGVGKLMVDAIFSRDYPVVQGCIVFFAFAFIVVNLIVDLLYGVFNPRVKH